MVEVKVSNWIYISIIILGLFISNGKTQAIGSWCYHLRKGVAGACETLDNCDSAAEDFFINDFDPQLCGFTGPRGRTQIVCCPGIKPAPPPKAKIRGQYEKKSRFYCREYASKVFQYIVSEAREIPVNTSTCGRSSVPSIFGGEVAKSQEFPHMALIGYGEVSDIQWNCGGTLISEEWVMTAAHCCDTNFGYAKFVRLAELDYEVTHDATETQDFTVIEIKTPPKRGLLYDDIGLLKLNKKIVFTPYVRPACLYPDYQIKSSSAIATGWGNVGLIGEKRPKLLKVTLRLSSLKECNNHYKNINELKKGIEGETQVCAAAGKNDTFKYPWNGYSGGPLQIDAEPEFYCMYYVIGVNSFGKACGILKTPTVFTRVSAYIPWIESVVWPN